ncbi:hypothetical protein BHY07_04245 [Bacillus subtilis subsp. subtilis]|nr:hypothetical protein QU35_04255 [Bacillus subtilis subsp. subtilis str. 168]AIY96349.1 hypothetical protein QX56_04250 [Bacillus subtilis]AJE93416.1 hypothetical protein RP72_04135 [Bacillus subtilis subsp. subtilis]AKC46290.1 hypothetical protein O7A_04250 [Bacillus subtilis KCTC 1028 = ATCC 6051a]AOL28387.1 hypothetical protein BGM23_18010 [Bacillus sp. FJAT-14266]AOL32534.1 hypothetical protein BGM20_18915 [Alkalicoccobacillus gibsonii]EME08280.1 hypothetical protein BS732_1287 [Bacillu
MSILFHILASICEGELSRSHFAFASICNSKVYAIFLHQQRFVQFFPFMPSFSETDN